MFVPGVFKKKNPKNDKITKNKFEKMTKFYEKNWLNQDKKTEKKI